MDEELKRHLRSNHPGGLLITRWATKGNREALQIEQDGPRSFSIVQVIHGRRSGAHCNIESYEKAVEELSRVIKDRKEIDRVRFYPAKP